MFYLVFFVVGTAIGSFVSVLATRLNVAKVINARSKCLSCGEKLKAKDLIPIWSHLILGGKCRYCKTRYGNFSLFVEIIYGFIFVLLYNFFLKEQSSLFVSSIWFIYYSLLFVVMGVIALYDKLHNYIPVSYLISYCVLTFIMLFVRYINYNSYIDLLAPLFVALPFLLIWAITRGKGLGFGDILLFLGVGAFFGIEQGFAVLFLSVWLGAIVGIIIYVLRRRKNIKSTAIPFVPFIVISFLFVLFTDIDVFSIANIFAK